MSVTCLHGVADRDPNELVCMFFTSKAHAEQFAEELPGRYAYVTLIGVSFPDLVVES